MSVCAGFQLHRHFLSIQLPLLSQVFKPPAAEASLLFDPAVLDAANVPLANQNTMSTIYWAAPEKSGQVPCDATISFGSSSTYSEQNI